MTQRPLPSISVTSSGSYVTESTGPKAMIRPPRIRIVWFSRNAGLVIVMTSAPTMANAGSPAAVYARAGDASSRRTNVVTEQTIRIMRSPRDA